LAASVVRGAVRLRRKRFGQYPDSPRLEIVP